MPSTAYHYDVEITPDHPKKFFRTAFNQFAFQYFKNYAIAFDGRKSCYTVDLLPLPAGGVQQEVKVIYNL